MCRSAWAEASFLASQGGVPTVGGQDLANHLIRQIYPDPLIPRIAECKISSVNPMATSLSSAWKLMYQKLQTLLRSYLTEPRMTLRR